MNIWLTVVYNDRGSLPPTIAIAMYQSSVVSDYFLTFGYFIAIAGFLALPVLPRGKFVVHLLICAFSTCVAAAVSLLVIWSALRARFNTSTTLSYNSSQNAVSAIWLIANTWVVSVLRAKIPSFSIPSILYTIVIYVTCTQSPIFTTMTQGERVIRELLVSILSGLGLAAATNFIVVPISSRMIVSGQTKRMIGLLQAALRKQKTYLRSIESEGLIPVSSQASKRHANTTDREPTSNEAILTDLLKTNNDALLKLAGELRAETEFAQWDVAFGKLDGNDVEQIFKLLRGILVPM
jgi:hypothetical protein